jgi:hypothetical protein
MACVSAGCAYVNASTCTGVRVPVCDVCAFLYQCACVCLVCVMCVHVYVPVYGVSMCFQVNVVRSVD